MAYQALYRVWRSQTFQDVVGQTHITKTLQNALLQQKISHAYLFSGPRGTGKTSAARILAKAVNCEQAPVSEPCNQCPSCLGIMDGSIPDVLEIDAASNNGVEEIRDLRDKVKYVPAVAKYKVYIIDEVHMLSTGAFNALLKTLEEPPEHVIFILATTEPHKIPLTIHSRCQRYDFKQIAAEAIVNRMKTVLEGSNYACEEAALAIIARAARGGMRDALSLLDQAISYSEDKVTEADALAITGSVSQRFITKLSEAVFEGNSAAALSCLEEVMEAGKDPMRFAEEMIYYYRDMLLHQVSKSDKLLDDEFINLAEKIPVNNLYTYIEEWNKAIQEMKWSLHPRIFLEVTLVRLCQPIVLVANTGDSQALYQRIEQLENAFQQLKATGKQEALTQVKEPNAPSQVSTQNDIGSGRPVSGEPEPEKEASHPTFEGLSQTPNESNQPIIRKNVDFVLQEATKKDKDVLLNLWQDLKQSCFQESSSQAALCEEAEPIAASSRAFVLKFNHEIHSDLAFKNIDFFQKMSNYLREKTGIQYEIVPVAEKAWLAAREKFLQAGKSSLQAKEKDEPAVSKAKDLFGEDIVEIIN